MRRSPGGRRCVGSIRPVDAPAAPSTVGSSSGHLLPVAAVAVGALVGFRMGLVPGGIVAVDVLLALFGWWLGSAVSAEGGLRERAVHAWVAWWPPALAAVGLACCWVLINGSTARDAVVRGQALAAFGGYGNWHLLAVGPREADGSLLATPLQHLWLGAVAAQLFAAFALAWWLTRPRARRRVDARDPLVVVGLVLWVASVLVIVGQMVAGSGGQALLLATWSRGGAFFLGVSLGALRPGPAADTVRAVLVGTRWIAVAMVVVLAALASPTSTAWRSGGALGVPVLAALVVGSFLPWPPGRRSRALPPALDPWSLLVAFWVLHVPVLAYLERTTVPTVVADVVGLVVAGALAVAVVSLVRLLPEGDEARQWRTVLIPPVVVLLFVVLFSVTGAFHWFSPYRLDGALGSGPR